MVSFQQRLRAAMEAGSLSLGDLTHWFDRPRPTVRYWCHQAQWNFEPWKDPRGDEAWKRLRLLEWAVEKKLGFPVPLALGARERPKYIVETYNALRARVPDARIARDRAKNLLHDHPEPQG